MIKGYWLCMLHSHLPFVKHPEYDYFLEEHWLFEAISETYLPIIMRMKKMTDKGIDFHFTTSITPPLAEMLADEYLIDQYIKHINKLIKLSEEELVRLKNNKDFLPVAAFYNNLFNELKSFYINELDCSIINGYKKYSDIGKIEIITCAATHGFLPILSVNRQAVEVQLRVAVETHKNHFGKYPQGIWLPECAFYEGLDDVLSKYGIKYFFLDTHGLNNGSPQ
ncbi:glycoside hydrolase family protein, partial [Candidatus Magnetoovum chiemensis]